MIEPPQEMPNVRYKPSEISTASSLSQSRLPLSLSLALPLLRLSEPLCLSPTPPLSLPHAVMGPPSSPRGGTQRRRMVSHPPLLRAAALGGAP